VGPSDAGRAACAASAAASARRSSFRSRAG
jgi:hypothetical protein